MTIENGFVFALTSMIYIFFCLSLLVLAFKGLFDTLNSRNIKNKKKRKEQFFKDFAYNLKVSGWFFLFSLRFIMIGLLGSGLYNIVYKLNQPLGLDYALFAACACSAILYAVIPSTPFPKKEEEANSK